MKFRYQAIAVAIVALAIANGYAQPINSGQHAQEMEKLEQRFQQMDRMMEEAERANGPKRREWLLVHLRTMREQMSAVHHVMTRMRGSGRMLPAPGSPMDRLQQRLDIMESMMDQMLKQQESMLESR